MSKFVVTEVKGVPGKIAFIYEYKDPKTGSTNEKIVIMDADTPADQMKHLEPALEGHYGQQDKPRLVLKELITVEITIHEG